MPIYEYQCSTCRSYFEQMEKMMTSSSERSGPSCVHCGSSDTRRVVSRVAVFKPASPGVGRAAFPTSWEATNGGDPETVSYWQRRVERELNQESRDTGLTHERSLVAERQWSEYVARTAPTDASPVDMGETSADEGVVNEGHGHGHDHAHDHGHSHPHGEAQGAESAGTGSGTVAVGHQEAGRTGADTPGGEEK